MIIDQHTQESLNPASIRHIWAFGRSCPNRSTASYDFLSEPIGTLRAAMGPLSALIRAGSAGAGNSSNSQMSRGASAKMEKHDSDFRHGEPKTPQQGCDISLSNRRLVNPALRQQDRQNHPRR